MISAVGWDLHTGIISRLGWIWLSERLLLARGSRA